MLEDITKEKCSFTMLRKQSSKMMYDLETKVQKKISKKSVGRMLKHKYFWVLLSSQIRILRKVESISTLDTLHPLHIQLVGARLGGHDMPLPLGQFHYFIAEAITSGNPRGQGLQSMVLKVHSSCY